MAVKRSTSRGIRPVPYAWISGVVMIAGILLVVKGVAHMRESGRSGSPHLMLGLFPALLGPIGFVYYLRQIPVVRALRRGTTAIARWTVSADEFRRFCDADARVEAETRTANFLKLPSAIPENGVEIIFATDGVLIGDGYFPLSTTKGRRVHRVRSIATNPPMIEFAMILETRARTSSTTSAAVRTTDTLRVPVASDAVREADQVVRQFDVAIARR